MRLVIVGFKEETSVTLGQVRTLEPPRGAEGCRRPGSTAQRGEAETPAQQRYDASERMHS